MKLQETIEALRSKKKKIFVAYVTAGDPDLKGTADVLKILEKADVDVVELGVPFSDPVADGPTNQLAAERGLQSRTSLTKILNFISQQTKRGFSKPIVLFTYFNPILKMGIEKFAKDAARAGAAGVLVVDLPPEEALETKQVFQKHGLATPFLASPTTSNERLRVIDEFSSGFVYYVSRTGVTGARTELSATLKEELEKVRRVVKKPLVVGFGISTPEQAKLVSQVADGVVVGSAIVKTWNETPAQLFEFVNSLSKAIRRAEG